MLQNATPLRKFPPWSPNTSNSCVSSAAPAMGHASVQILFKCPTPAIIFETATKPSRCVHFWQGALSLVQKCSVPLVFLTFWLGNVLRATAACTFSTSQLPKVLRTWGVFSVFTCKCASRDNRVQFFISRLARLLRTRRFSEPTFRPSGATNHWKNTVFRDFPTFSRT